MLPAGIRATGMIKDIFPGLDLYGTGPAQHTITAGWALDDQDRDLSVGRVEHSRRPVFWCASRSPFGLNILVLSVGGGKSRGQTGLSLLYSLFGS